MTFSELTKRLNPLDDSQIKWILKELILFNSKIIENSSDIFFEKDTEIDFEYKKILKQLNKVLNKNIPVQYITKSFSFYGLSFFIKKGCFVPRQETEYMLDWAVKQKKLIDKKYILDLCSGSGVLANTISYIKKNKDAIVIGVEKNRTPYKVGVKNQRNLKLKTQFIKSDIFKIDRSHYEKCDFIICNPPYIDKNDPNVDPSTKCEPKQALFAPQNGYYFYFRFLSEIYPILANGTEIIFEIGFNQKEEIEKFLIKNNITVFKFLKDLDDKDRVLYIKK
ncbi:peptide chain release factor N(5)-glutamine methyltransferase [Malacoplasma penetrans]|nr:peptide chain release factor N(5)-glutamine methyltransferase [Malacoplasma penetrans]